MDSIKTLMDKREYDLVIRLTENSKDADSIFYRIGALLGVGRGEDALKCVEKNQKILQKDLRFLIKVHIDILCILGRFDEAFEVLNYYRELPYESQEVEELLRALPKIIRDEEKSSYERNNLSDDDLRHKLKSLNKIETLNGINLASKRDFNLFRNEFENILISFPDQDVRSYALLMMVQNKIVGDFRFLSSNGIINVNPSQLEQPFDKAFQNLFKRLMSEFKNPSLSDNAISFLSTYLIHTYPLKIEFEEDYVVGVLYYLSARALMMRDIKDKYDYCLDRNLSIDKFNKIYDIFFEIVNKK